MLCGQSRSDFRIEEESLCQDPEVADVAAVASVEASAADVAVDLEADPEASTAAVSITDRISTAVGIAGPIFTVAAAAWAA